MHLILSSDIEFSDPGEPVILDQSADAGAEDYLERI